jgi:hypothetical protein
MLTSEEIKNAIIESGESFKEIEGKKEEFEKTLPPAFLKDLYILSEDADFAGPWHGLATYGEVREGVHYAAVEICTKVDKVSGLEI